MSTFLQSLRGVVEASVVMVAAVIAVRLGLIEAGVPPAARLALCLVVGALVYLPVCAWRSPELLREFDGVRRRFRRSRVPIGGVQPSEP